VSPVSKGRKRKPVKSRRKTVVRRERPAFRSQFEVDPQDENFDATAYLDDLSPGMSEAEIADTVDRRVFAMPFHGATVRGEDFPHLDPADPDERRLLIEGEHPEYHQALADPMRDVEIDGANPRLHLTIHEVIVNQLWADDPPEVWQAARRLRSAGMDRHDILHELMGVMVEYMHPTLTRNEPFDSDGYRRSLTALTPDTGP
jgi:hypothetical protein